jgi:hypothetical protein
MSERADAYDTDLTLWAERQARELASRIRTIPALACPPKSWRAKARHPRLC